MITKLWAIEYYENEETGRCLLQNAANSIEFYKDAIEATQQLRWHPGLKRPRIVEVTLSYEDLTEATQ